MTFLSSEPILEQIIAQVKRGSNWDRNPLRVFAFRVPKPPLQGECDHENEHRKGPESTEERLIVRGSFRILGIP